MNYVKFYIARTWIFHRVLEAFLACLILLMYGVEERGVCQVANRFLAENVAQELLGVAQSLNGNLTNVFWIDLAQVMGVDGIDLLASDVDVHELTVASRDNLHIEVIHRSSSQSM